MAKLDDLVARLRLDSRDFTTGMRGVEATMGRVQRQATSTGNVLKGVLGGAAVIGGVRALTGFLRGGVTELMEMDAAAAQTSNVIRSTGGAAFVTASQVDALATKLQGLTGIQDDQIVSAQNFLLTFDRISGNGGMFERATRAAIDLSVAWGQDTKSSAIQLGKALQDPIKGVTALNRVGVQFLPQQRKQIEAMVEAGDIAGAQGVILGELERQVGGSAEAFGETLPGKVERGKRAIEDFQESLVADVVPFIADTAIPAFNKLSDAIAGVFDAEGLGTTRDFGKNFKKGIAVLQRFITDPLGTAEGEHDKELARRFQEINKEARRTPSQNVGNRLDDLLKSGNKAVGVNRRVAESVQDVTTATEEQADAAKNLTRAQHDLAAAHRRVDDALFDLADAEDDLREAQFRQGAGSEEAIKAGRNVERARLRVADAHASVAADVVAVSEANKAAAEAVSSGLTKVANAVDNLARAAGVPGAGVAGVRADTGNLLRGATINFNGITDHQALAQTMNRELDWYNRGPGRRAI